MESPTLGEIPGSNHAPANAAVPKRGGIDSAGHATPGLARRANASPRGATPKFEASEPALGLRDRVLFEAMRAALFLLSLIPDFVLYPLAVAGALIVHRLDRRHARIGLKNLAIAFPECSEAERQRILRASYANLGRSAAEYIRLGGCFYRRLIGRISYDGIERREDVERRYPGRGVLILTAHFGSFELLPAGHALRGHQISLVHRTQSFVAGDALLSWVRRRAGVETLRKRSAARAVLKALRAGKLVGIPLDQNTRRREAVFVSFFSELAATTGGLARLALMSGAPVVPVFIVRQPDSRTHRIEIQDEIPLAKTGNLEADILENTRRFNAAIEAIVRRYPEQFLWTHRRYRTRPPGASKVYDC